MDIEEMKTTLAMLILNELSFEFAQQHLSLNLINTMKVTFSSKGIKIEIPAPAYNMAEYRRSGTIVYKGHGSYANKLDTNGSRWKHHKGYVDRCIYTAIDKWSHLYGLDVPGLKHRHLYGYEGREINITEEAKRE